MFNGGIFTGAGGGGGGGLTEVSHDATLTGKGTPGDPLSVVEPNALGTNIPNDGLKLPALFSVADPDPAWVDITGMEVQVTIDNAAKITGIFSFATKKGGAGMAIEGNLRIVMVSPSLVSNVTPVYMPNVNDTAQGSCLITSPSKLSPGTYTIKAQVQFTAGGGPLEVTDATLWAQGQQAAAENNPDEIRNTRARRAFNANNYN